MDDDSIQRRLTFFCVRSTAPPLWRAPFSPPPSSSFAPKRNESTIDFHSLAQSTPYLENAKKGEKKEDSFFVCVYSFYCGFFEKIKFLIEEAMPPTQKNIDAAATGMPLGAPFSMTTVGSFFSFFPIHLLDNNIIFIEHCLSLSVLLGIMLQLH